MTKILHICCLLFFFYQIRKETISAEKVDATQDSHNKSRKIPESGKIIVDGTVNVSWDYAQSFIVSLRKSHNIRHHIGSGSIFYGGQWIITTRSNLAKYREDRGRYALSEAFDIVVFPKYSAYLDEIQKPKKYYIAEKTFCHPLYYDTHGNQPPESSDIGLIKLKAPGIPVTRHGDFTQFHAVELIEDDIEIKNGTLARIGGWGVIDKASNDPPLSNPLRETNIPIYTDHKCSRDRNFRRPAHLCAYKEDVAVCDGDQGGPASIYAFETIPDKEDRMRRAYLAGVISLNQPDCRGNSHFMNVTHFRKFIDDVRRHEPRHFECKNMVYTAEHGIKLHEVPDFT